ncbi:rhodanese-like domain-containing protein [Cellulomonas sp.]|uniref:rhodanese-like domain-containing protein n=1 Tax=Cellulomonas sp. TaxID=40001 RepID=UPI0025C0880B|nr:rhodanese-like domain-containing protein [Cellulomonas sp.]
MTTSPPPATTPTFLERVRRLFGGGPDDGRVRPTVNATRALELVTDGATLVDVRESSEWKSGHAPRAVHIPLGQIDQGARRLTKSRPVVVVCASGMRSRTAAKQLRSLGYEATSVSGGMAAWQRAGGEVRR